MVDCESLPVFYQFVTNTLMEELVKLRYLIFGAVDDSDDEEVTLDYEEEMLYAILPVTP